MAIEGIAGIDGMTSGGEQKKRAKAKEAKKAQVGFIMRFWMIVTS